ncbi:hypothetical protein ACFC34_36210 [Streptomyces sp. NPDC056053]|uniref:hypothetical protein n=1 Tax=Streptomyces sp. NPDC056053 TaxID=3345696 RepID=UPI0035D78117
MTTDKQFKKDVRELAAAAGISYTAARRRLAANTTQIPRDHAAAAAGLLAARSRGKFTVEEAADRLERGGQEYASYLADGQEAAIEALEYALEHGVDAVDADLAAVAAAKKMPITTEDLAEALRRVRDHSLVIDGSSVAETAYWVTDRFWMHRWNNAWDQSAVGEYETVVEPNVYKRFALHEWMAPGWSSGSVPGLY